MSAPSTRSAAAREYWLRAGARFDEGDYEAAMVLYKGAVDADPTFAEAFNGLGLTFYEHGWYWEAVMAYQKAISLKRDFAEAFTNLGAAFFRMGHLEVAVEQYRRALELAPDHAETHNNLALALEQAGRASEAIPHFERFVELWQGDQALAEAARTRVAKLRQGVATPLAPDPGNWP